VASVVAWVLLAILLSAAGVYTWRALSRSAAARGARRARSADDDGPGELGPDAAGALAPLEGRDESRLRDEAAALARRGDLRGALRALYRVVLLSLERAGLAKLERGRTNWEHVASVRRRDAVLATRLAPLTATFDDAWYGEHPFTEEAYSVCREQVDALVRDLSTRSTEGDPNP
jgi:hypothetical protein